MQLKQNFSALVTPKKDKVLMYSVLITLMIFAYYSSTFRLEKISDLEVLKSLGFTLMIFIGLILRKLVQINENLSLSSNETKKTGQRM